MLAVLPAGRPVVVALLMAGEVDNRWKSLPLTETKRGSPHRLLSLLVPFLSTSAAGNSVEQVQLLPLNETMLPVEVEYTRLFWKVPVGAQVTRLLEPE